MAENQPMTPFRHYPALLLALLLLSGCSMGTMVVPTVGHVNHNQAFLLRGFLARAHRYRERSYQEQCDCTFHVVPICWFRKLERNRRTDQYHASGMCTITR